ncbi:MAG TPA: NAD(P)H-dependent oxidoreductase, partial [Bacillota bacterium]|nr:NAD(P)H-dependent oxidoreductase [Bacillota bacterium]
IEPVEVKYLYLSDIDLGFCHGCLACIDKGEELCPKRKLTAAIEAELTAADGVILAAPVYAHQVTALMKNFMDHFAYFFHRPRFFDKTALVLSTTGGSGLKETLGYLKFTATGWGFNVIGSLGVISSFFNKEADINKTAGCGKAAKYRTQKLREIDAIATQMIKGMKTGERKAPGSYELMLFRGMRYKARYNPCDSKYWEAKGWFSERYYVKGPVNPVTLAVVNFLDWVMGVIYSKMAKGSGLKG